MAAFNHRVQTPANPDGMRDRDGRPWLCRCGEPATLFACYTYVGGKRRQTLNNYRSVCRACAEEFAAKHGVTMPA